MSYEHKASVQTLAPRENSDRAGMSGGDLCSAEGRGMWDAGEEGEQEGDAGWLEGEGLQPLAKNVKGSYHWVIPGADQILSCSAWFSYSSLKSFYAKNRVKFVGTSYCTLVSALRSISFQTCG